MLPNLNKLAQEIKDQLQLFNGLDCLLPEQFKNAVRSIGNDVVTYGKNSAIITNSFGQNIYISNSWFYIAASLSPLYIPFETYRQTLLKYVDKETLKSKDKNRIISELLRDNGLSADDRDNLILFATDYEWWTAGAAKDGKSLDRADCLMSAILAIANVVNNSQSYIATLWNYFGVNPKIANLLNDDFQKYQASSNVLITRHKLSEFVFEVFNYLSGTKEINEFEPYAVESSPRYYNSSAKIIKLTSNDFKESLVDLFLEASKDEVKERNESAVRWFDQPIQFLNRTVFVSTQWNETGSYQLTLPDLKKYIDVCFNGKYKIEKTTDGDFVFIEINKEKKSSPRQLQLPSDPLQQIFYGAPGTGKSHGIEEATQGQMVIRTTFHPDSDYSTFIGAYKPVMREIPLTTVIGTKCVPVEDGNGKPVAEKKIEYDFIPQAFTEAYVEAWKDLKKPVYLVIEEINRGNCAQIFGDIFQLLDRNDNGYSSYTITPDEDLHRYLEETFEKDGFDEDCGLDNTVILDIWEGKKMCLPPNLYIWATMNTSDQSLFPIDSAFKRRWDWKYVPIDPNKENWTIEVNGESYKWSSFLININNEIGETTSSEDKKLGFYFCKAKDCKVSAEKFVSKVLFYVYNDVFKDYGFDKDFFKGDDGKPMSFQSFYNVDGTVNEAKVAKLLTNLKVETIKSTEEKVSSDEEQTLKDEGSSSEGGKHDFIGSVTIDDETFSKNDMTHFEVYMSTLKKIGIDRVAPIIEGCKYKRLKCDLATKTPQDAIINAPNYEYVKEGDYYFVKGAADETLINVLKVVKDQLSLNLEIEIYR